MSSHKTDWIISELLITTLACLLYGNENNLMCDLERGYLCLWDISINVNSIIYVIVVCVVLFTFVLAVLLLLVYFFIPFLYWCCCYIFVDLLIMLTNPIIFVFEAFVYHFKNTISILVTKFFLSYYIRACILESNRERQQISGKNSGSKWNSHEKFLQ